MKKISELEVATASEDYLFYGDDAEAVYKEIFVAGMNGADWTVPIKLRCGKEITFVLPNIISFTSTPETEKA